MEDLYYIQVKRISKKQTHTHTLQTNGVSLSTSFMNRKKYILFVTLLVVHNIYDKKYYNRRHSNHGNNSMNIYANIYNSNEYNNNINNKCKYDVVDEQTNLDFM